jgi:hypothetical protein
VRAHVDADAVVAATAALVGVDTQNPPGDERAALPVARDLLAGFGARFEEVGPPCWPPSAPPTAADRYSW